MSTSVAKTTPIGPVQVYWNNVRLGFPKSQAAFRYAKEHVEQKIDDSGLPVMTHKTGERMEIDVVIQDFKPSQGRYIYDQAASYSSRSTLKTVTFTATASVVFRWRDAVKLSGTANLTLDGAGFEAGTITVSKSDFSQEYTSGTDYTSDGSAGTIARLAGGSISDQQTVYVEYNQSATSSIVYGGGELADFEAALRLVHVLDNGKHLVCYAYRAKKINASDWSIQTAAEQGGIPMTFLCLGDMAQAPGKQLFYFAVET